MPLKGSRQILNILNKGGGGFGVQNSMILNTLFWVKKATKSDNLCPKCTDGHSPKNKII